MPFLSFGELPERERRSGWHGRHFNSESMTFGRWRFEAGATIHEHRHPQEEVWLVVAGELEITVDGETRIAVPGGVAVVPPDTAHAVRALSDGTAIAVDYPVRADFS